MVTTFFGKLPAGPVVQYSDLKKQWQQREIGMDTLKQGMRLYIGGFAKLVILHRGTWRSSSRLSRWKTPRVRCCRCGF